MAIERKRSEEALREKTDEQQTLLVALKQQRDFLRTLSDNIPDLIWAKDMDGRYLFANKAMCDVLLKCDCPDEALGKTDLFFAERVRARGCRHDFGEMCRRHRPGDPRHAEAGQVRRIRAHPGGIHLARGPQGAALRHPRRDDRHGGLRPGHHRPDPGPGGPGGDARTRYRTLVDHMPNPIVVYREGKVIYANPTMLAISGYTLEELIGRSPWSSSPPSTGTSRSK